MRQHGSATNSASSAAGDPGALEGSELRRRRVALGLSQSQLARRLGIAPNTLARWERGDHPVGNPALVRLAFNQLMADRPAKDARIAPTPAPAVSATTGARAEAQPHSLPIELTTFVGRERELGELKALLSSARLLTLTGPGGVGKTRLALRLAAQVQALYRDGVAVVELSSLASPDLVIDEVASALDIPAQSHVPLSDVLIARLRGRQLLLVLDNCDLLVEACAPLAALVLSRCPGVRILATSRSILRATCETVWEVRGLDLPPYDCTSVAALVRSSAGRLFVDRSGVAEHTLDAEQAAAIVRLCYRLDGLPLALELAAASLKVLTPAQLVSRLNDALGILTLGSNDAPARQRTLRATLDWSYGLISNDDRTLLARLSVFSGGATLPAVEAVCGPGDTAPVVEGLYRLISASLVQRRDGAESGPRFSLLETIRAYAAERLYERGETEMLRGRHARYYANLPADPLYDRWAPLPGRAARRLQPEADNLRASAMWARDLGDVDLGFTLVWGLGFPRDSWYRQGSTASSFREVVSWGETFLALDEPRRRKPNPMRARAMVATGYCVLFEGLTERARTLVREAQAEFEQLGDLAGQACAIHVLGHIELYAGNPAEAEARANHALELARQVGESQISTWALVTLGVVAAQQGRTEEGRHYLEDALSRARLAGQGHVVPRALLALGWIYCRLNDVDSADEAYRAALQVGRDDSDPPAMLLALDGLARVSYVKGNMGKAARLLGAANSLWRGVEITVVRNPYDPSSHDDLILKLQVAMGQTEFNRLSLAAESVPLDDIVCEALLVETTDSVESRSGGTPALTAREHEVAELVARGFSNRQIAEKLVVSERTIETHVSHILQRLGLASRVQIGIWSTKHNRDRTPLSFRWTDGVGYETAGAAVERLQIAEDRLPPLVMGAPGAPIDELSSSESQAALS